MRIHDKAIWAGARFTLPLLVFLFIVTALADEPKSEVAPPASASEAFRLFADLLDNINKNYVDNSKVNTTEIAPTAFREFLKQLDPEADLLTPDQVMALQGAPLLADVALAARGGKVVVVCPRDGSAAQKAGLMAGDEVVCHNNSLSLARSIVQSKSVLMVRGVLTNAVKTVPIGEPAYNPVTLKILSDGIVYHRLSEISDASLKNLEDQLTVAVGNWTRGMILDLRNNPGGSLDAALHGARIFLPAKATIGGIEYADAGHRARFIAEATGKFPRKASVILLVNRGTSAEAEVFAAALSDNGQAMLLGNRTFGNGRVISNIPLHDGYALYLPTARFITPAGQSFYPNGLTPDEYVVIAPETERTLAAKGYGNFNWQTDRKSLLESDHALARALELLTKTVKK